MVTVLNQIHERDFLGFSYGFRPGRSPHQALNALLYALTKRKVSYVLDADLRGFFDNLDRSHIRLHIVRERHNVQPQALGCKLGLSGAQKILGRAGRDPHAQNIFAMASASACCKRST